MRKIILNVAVSLDGLIEGKNGEFDWCLTDQDYGMTSFIENIDTIIFGRKSYQVMEAYDENPYPEKKKFIFTKTLSVNKNNTYVINEDAATFCQNLKNQEGSDIWLFGGQQIVTSLLNNNLIEEMVLSIHPLILGEGKPLFEGIRERKHFHLQRSINYSSGLTQLFYSKK